MDRAARLRAWRARGGSRPRPGPRLLPTAHDLKTVSVWAVLIQLTGMLGFNLATIGSIVEAAIPMEVGLAAAVPTCATRAHAQKLRCTCSQGCTAGIHSSPCSFTPPACIAAIQKGPFGGRPCASPGPLSCLLATACLPA